MHIAEMEKGIALAIYMHTEWMLNNVIKKSGCDSSVNLQQNLP